MGVVGGSGVGDRLGGVLRQVAGDLLGAQRTVGVVGAAVAADRAGVELAAEGQEPGRVLASTPGTVNRTEAAAARTRSAKRRGVDRGGGGREPVGGAGAVEPDQGMEVDHATDLVLSDLGVLHRRHLGQPVRRHLQLLGDQPAQGDREPAPQVRCPPLPDHMGGVVVAVRRTAAARAPGRPRHAGPGSSGAGRARRSPRCLRAGGSGGHSSRLPCTGPNDGAVTVANTSGFSATDSARSCHRRPRPGSGGTCPRRRAGSRTGTRWRAGSRSARG